MSIMTFAVFTTMGWNLDRQMHTSETTSIAVMMFSYPPLGGNSGNRSICMKSSSPRSYSGIWINSGVIRVLFMRLT